MNNFKLNKTGLLLLLLFVLFFTSASVLMYLYQVSPRKAIKKQQFENVLHKKELKANEVLQQIANSLEKNASVDSIPRNYFKNSDIIYYVYRNHRLVFWSNNTIAPNNDYDFPSEYTDYVKLPNQHCVYSSKTVGQDRIVALIVLKFEYSAESDVIENHFVSDFNTNKNIIVSSGNNSDLYSISNLQGRHMFSLVMPNTPIYNSDILIVANIAYLLSFIFFFLFYSLSPKLLNHDRISLKTFLLLFLLSTIVIIVFLGFNIPSGFFKSSLGLSDYYKANSILMSFGHLTLLTFYIVSNIYLFFSTVNISSTAKKNLYVQILMQLAFFAFFVLFYFLVMEIVFASTVEISILSFDDLDFSHLWMHFLFVLWGLSFILLFFKTYSWIKYPKHYIIAITTNIVFVVLLYIFSAFFIPAFATRICILFVLLVGAFLFTLRFYTRFKFYSNYLNGVYIFIITAIITFTVSSFEDARRDVKFKAFAENIYSGNNRDEQVINNLFSKLSKDFLADKTLKNLISKTDSNELAESYISANYFNDLWTSFDLSVSVYNTESDIYKSYVSLLNEYKKIPNSNFISLSASNESAYVGIFDMPSDSISFILNLSPNRVYRSYSFPNLLIANRNSEQVRLNIATATYENNNLVSSSGRFNYPSDAHWLPTDDDSWYSFSIDKRRHYVLVENNNEKIVVTDLKNHSPQVYIIYFFYSFIIYFVLFWLYVTVVAFASHKRLKVNFISRFQYLFFALFLLSFFGVFLVSSDFLKQKYQRQQIKNMEEKRTYIQKILQEKYYWEMALTPRMAKSIATNLQDLSYTFQTDIHVYDTNGMLISSSQPIIFNRNLISRRISPEVFFYKNQQDNDYESIGELQYLTSYTEFYNGDYLQIGYIAIPQYFSEVDVMSETQEFLKFIIHIYVIAFIISLVLSNVIRRRLSAPLENLEKSLKEMRLGRRNEKIEYNANDEISQLVKQYNNTVDELEQSALLLAKSERESAWKTMARQVAHEINNPLTPMKLSIQQLQRTKKIGGEQFDNYFDKSTNILIEQIDNLSNIASTFSNFAKIPEAKFEKTNITEKLYSVVELFKNNNEMVDIELRRTAGDVYVFADPEQMVQVFNNLLKNAIQAIPSKQVRKIEVEIFVEGSEVRINISDNGVGISDEIKDKLFIPNFTTKSRGTGLGLAITKNIVETTGGRISFVSEKGVGTTFSVILPMLV